MEPRFCHGLPSRRFIRACFHCLKPYARAPMKPIESELLAALEDAEFLLRKVSTNPREIVFMLDSLKRCAADAREIIEKAKQSE